MATECLCVCSIRWSCVQRRGLQVLSDCVCSFANLLAPRGTLLRVRPVRDSWQLAGVSLCARASAFGPFFSVRVCLPVCLRARGFSMTMFVEVLFAFFVTYIRTTANERASGAP